ncbi:MAG: hypothetical protein Q4B60_01650 [Erysipelotrichaceae bacterium]|nr:hypothetical protein [Erysipelotrichaceae bacterium]
MKCVACGYKEVTDEETLKRMRELPPYIEEDRMLCPFCLEYMYRADSDRFNNK